MYKFMYDKLKKHYYEEKTKEEMMQEILSLEEIECSNRAFANHCEAGISIFNINELFAKLETLNIPQISKITEDANNSWNNIKRGIREINDNSRIYNNLNNFKQRVNNAINDDDSI